eukprot:g18941.t1
MSRQYARDYSYPEQFYMCGYGDSEDGGAHMLHSRLREFLLQQGHELMVNAYITPERLTWWFRRRQVLAQDMANLALEEQAPHLAPTGEGESTDEGESDADPSDGEPDAKKRKLDPGAERMAAQVCDLLLRRPAKQANERRKRRHGYSDAKYENTAAAAKRCVSKPKKAAGGAAQKQPAGKKAAAPAKSPPAMKKASAPAQAAAEIAPEPLAAKGKKAAAKAKAAPRAVLDQQPTVGGSGYLGFKDASFAAKNAAEPLSKSFDKRKPNSDGSSADVFEGHDCDLSAAETAKLKSEGFCGDLVFFPWGLVRRDTQSGVAMDGKASGFNSYLVTWSAPRNPKAKNTPAKTKDQDFLDLIIMAHDAYGVKLMKIVAELYVNFAAVPFAESVGYISFGSSRKFQHHFIDEPLMWFAEGIMPESVEEICYSQVVKKQDKPMNFLEFRQLVEDTGIKSIRELHVATNKMDCICGKKERVFKALQVWSEGVDWPGVLLHAKPIEKSKWSAGYVILRWADDKRRANSFAWA